MSETSLNHQLKRLQLSDKCAISLGNVEPDYVLDFAVQMSEDMLAATSSNYNIRLYSRKNLANIGSIKGHTDVVTGITFGNTEKNLLYSSSRDETVRCWDLRVGLDEEVQTFKGPESVRPKLTCVDVDCTDRLVCAGTEEDVDNSYVLFWDRRKGQLLGCYGDSHQGDITQVRLHPTNKDHLASSSDDGLVCTFDISQLSEDDALLYTFNAECSVSCIGWYGHHLTSLYCLTSIDTFHVWDTVEGDDQEKLKDIKENLKGSSSVDYIVNVLSSSCDDTDILVAGTYGGNLQIVEVVGDSVTVLKTLTDGHQDQIRCCHWDEQSGSLVTGGEDSRLCLWSPTQTTQTTQTQSRDTSKSKVKLKRKGRKTPY